MQGNLTSNTMQVQVQGQVGVAYVQQGSQQQLPNIQVQANKQFKKTCFLSVITLRLNRQRRPTLVP